jgi:alkylation response protein AidB-like acyl-CoA dehydrogenase
MDMVSLTNEQRMIVNTVNNLARAEFSEKACTWQGEKPWENIKTLADEGFLAVNLPEEYGGGGMTEFETLLVMETVGRTCPDTAKALFETNFISPRMVSKFAPEKVKQEYLPPVANGEEHIVIAISEPQGGSDIQAIETRVEERGDELVLNGEKIWVSGPDASSAVVWAKFPEGLGAVLVDLDAEGVELSEVYTNMFGGDQGHFFFNEVVIPRENVLVRGEEEFTKMVDSLNWERLGGAIFANLIAICAFEKALDYAQEREQFGQPIGDFQGIEWKLADMAKQIEVSRAFTHQAAKSASENNRIPDEFETTIAKCFSAEMVDPVVSEALQIHGAAGYQQGHPLEYLYRLARSRRIGGGTTEMQKNSIATVLKRDGYNPIGGGDKTRRAKEGSYTQL